MWIPFFQEYITGTTDVVKITNTIPPNDVIAMDTMTSAPRSEDMRTGIKANMVVAAIIMAGRIRHSPAKTTASRISLYVS